MQHLEIKKELAKVIRTAYSKGWITSRDGNVSFRSSDEFYITESGVLKSEITEKQVIQSIFVDDVLLFTKDSPTPSGELSMHLALQTPTKSRSVLHLHPTYTVAAMHRGFDLMKLASEFPEVYRYTKVGPTVPKYAALSEELARVTREMMTKDDQIIYDIVGQVSHGVCSVAETPSKALEHVERLEHICQIVLASGVNPS